jgi:hypothetical protein
MQSTKTKIDSYPAPTQLATETDLSPQETKAITEDYNGRGQPPSVWIDKQFNRLSMYIVGYSNNSLTRYSSDI